MQLPPRSPPPNLFYTGLVASLYGPLRSETFDPTPYERFVRRTGQPALELGCGAGEPLLDLVAAGLDVEGVDSSSDMLDLCRAAAERRGLDVTVHQASMEEMDLGRRYRSIYLAGATFNLLGDDATTLAALLRIRDHLDDVGAALVPLFIPAPTAERDLGVARERIAPEGSTMRVTFVSEERDEAARTQASLLRYELLMDDRLIEAVERPWLLHWHTQDGFSRLVTAAGLTTLKVFGPRGGDAAYDATAFTFLLGAAVHESTLTI